MPSNTFKLSLSKAELQIGLWLACGDPYTASLVGQAGFDWLLVDAEHGPNDLRSPLLSCKYSKRPPHIAVRPAPANVKDIKRLLDIAGHNLLIPMVNAKQAHDLVAATRYPPLGKRGIGAGISWRHGSERKPIMWNEFTKSLAS